MALEGNGEDSHCVGYVVNRCEIKPLREGKNGDAKGAACARVDVGLLDKFASLCEFDDLARALADPVESGRDSRIGAVLIQAVCRV
ncbi:MAG TPA: hypothetical protein VMS87_06885, partial [Roseiarcus sp.]|nr:hypothetical protein [Roseiarcus sp.]